MAVTILSNPGQYQPVYSGDGHNLSYVVNSTNSFQCSMMYVMDVYINDVLEGRFKNSPNIVDGKCVFSLDGILHNFLTSDVWDGPAYKFNSNSYLKYMVQFGEETDGTSNCTGSDFTITMGPTHSGWTFNGTIQYLEKDFDELDYYISPTNEGGFLTNSPDEMNINIDDEQYLYYINNMEVLSASTGASASQALEVKLTYQNDTQTTYWVLNRIYTPTNTMLSIGVSPNHINSYVPLGLVYNTFGVQSIEPIIDCNVKSYEVRITDYGVTG